MRYVFEILTPDNLGVATVKLELLFMVYEIIEFYHMIHTLDGRTHVTSQQSYMLNQVCLQFQIDHSR